MPYAVAGDQARLRPACTLNYTTGPDGTRQVRLGTAGSWSPRPQVSRDPALGIALGDPFALVVEMAPPRNGQFHLGHPPPEVQPERDERITLLVGFRPQPRDLAAVEEELARPERVVVVDVPLRVRIDVQVVQPD